MAMALCGWAALGMGVGLLVVVICVVAGAAYCHARQRGKLDGAPHTWLLFGLVVWRWWGRFQLLPAPVSAAHQ